MYSVPSSEKGMAEVDLGNKESKLHSAVAAAAAAAASLPLFAVYSVFNVVSLCRRHVDRHESPTRKKDNNA